MHSEHRDHIARRRARHEMAAMLAAPDDMALLDFAHRPRRLFTPAALAGYADALLAHADPLSLPAGAVDICGTGGTAARRAAACNISTLSALAMAGAGACVVKHGGRAATSTSGSADLLAALGVVVTLDATEVARCAEEAGIAFVAAPALNPAVAHIGAVRRRVEGPTAFNLLLPLCHPGRPRRQLLGAGDLVSAALLAGALRLMGRDRAYVIVGADGRDEATLSGPTEAIHLHGGVTEESVVDPAMYFTGTRSEPAGGDVAHNVGLAQELLSGRPGPMADAVALNAGLGLVTAGLAGSLAEGIAAAAESVAGGHARGALDRLARTSQSLSAGRPAPSPAHG